MTTSALRWPARPEGLQLFMILAAVVVVASLPGFLGSPSTAQVVARALINLVIVVGLYLFIGNSGVLSFGHIAFMAIGGYTAALITVPAAQKVVLLPGLPEFIQSAQVNHVLATLLAAAAAGGFALVIGFLLMRLNGIAASLALFAVLGVVHEIATNWIAVTGGSAGVSGVPLTLNVPEALAWALLAVAVAAVAQQTHTFRCLRASREDEFAARALGIGVYRERVIAMAVSGAVIGIGGALHSQLIGSVTPDAFYIQITFLTLVMLIVGGMTSLSGAVVGTIVISALTELLIEVEEGIDVGFVSLSPRPGLSQIALAAFIVLMLIARPDGLTRGQELKLPRRLAGKPPNRAASARDPAPTG